MILPFNRFVWRRNSLKKIQPARRKRLRSRTEIVFWHRFDPCRRRRFSFSRECGPRMLICFSIFFTKIWKSVSVFRRRLIMNEAKIITDSKSEKQTSYIGYIYNNKNQNSTSWKCRTIGCSVGDTTGRQEEEYVEPACRHRPPSMNNITRIFWAVD